MTIPSVTISSGDGISFTNVNDSNLTISTNGVLFDSDETVTKQGNEFNGASQLVQLDGNGNLPVVNGHLLTNIGKIDIGVCSTNGATEAKEVTLSGFELSTGATIQVTFTNANTVTTPTLNVNSTGAKAIYNEAGTAVSATNPAYFPAGSTIEFTYNGTYWVFKQRVVENYVNGTQWYRIYSDGWKEQGGLKDSGIGSPATCTVTFLKPFAEGMISPSVISTGTNSYNNTLWINSSTLTTMTVEATIGTYFYWEVKGY